LELGHYPSDDQEDDDVTPALDMTGTGKRQEASGAALRADMKDDVSVLLQGKRLKINATVDAEGIARLKQVLDKYEEILKLLQ
jgi:hypothetical protein